jgi:NAD(P)-dependent dehydrogenase (short-subunit alcohol dehydrogenase family)
MFKPFDLTGKVAVVTGGNGGIGLGMAEGLAQAGAGVEIWGTNAEKNARAKERLSKYGVKINTRIVDVGSEQVVIDGMKAAVAEMGRVDCCIANAGMANRWRSFLDVGGEAYRKLMSVNVDGVLYTAREACRHMQARAEAGDPGGSIVIMSSMVSRFGGPRNEDYALSKNAVLGITNGIAVEFARYGIRANAILPGWVESDMTATAQGSEKFTQSVISRVPMRRWGKPEEFAGIAVYLASDASTFHNGDHIVLDGGYSMF